VQLVMPWQLQGQITINNWQQFVPTLLIVLTTIIYIPLSVMDIVQQVQIVARLELFQPVLLRSTMVCLGVPLSAMDIVRVGVQLFGHGTQHAH
jgi:uncharacterized membrane protein YadS